MNRSQVYVAAATVGFSFILIFTTVLKDTGMSSFEQLFFRLVFSILILLLITAFQRKLKLASWNRVPFFAAIGVTYAFFALSGLSAIAFGTPIAVSVALVYTQPIFTALISFATGKERATIGRILVVLLGVLGALLVSGLNLSDPRIKLGVVFPVLAGFLYAVYLWLKRQAPTDEYTPLQVLLFTVLFALLVLPVGWVVLRNISAEPLFVGVLTPSSQQLALLFFFALFCTVLPYGLLNYVNVKEASPTTEGMLLLGDPVLHTLWAMLFFGQYISAIQYAGAALILVSAAVSLLLRSKQPG